MKLKPQVHVELLLFIVKNPVLSIMFFQIDWKTCKTSFKQEMHSDSNLGLSHSTA